MRTVLTAALLASTCLPAQPALAGPFPQLISTCYPDRGKLPADFAEPVPAYDFVVKAKLPAGAKVMKKGE